MNICLDIETAPNWAQIEKHQSDAEAFCERKKCALEDLGLYPQWGKVVSIAWGTKPEEIDCNCSPSEEEVLGIAGGGDGILPDLLSDFDTILVGHNIKGFDIPFLAWRYIANGRQVPECLRVAGRKPWDIPHIDTMELLKFGGFNTCSLGDACVALGIPTPKGELCGKHVDALVKAGEFGKIRSYNMGDVRANMALYRLLYQLKAA